MLEFADEICERAEDHAKHDCSLVTVMAILRELPIEYYAEFLFSLPSPGRFPSLSSKLPTMASVESQKAWAAATGKLLWQQSSAFVQAMELAAFRHQTHPIKNARVLDFGCGYGRFMRLMTYYTDTSNIFGCDPQQKSLDECRKHNVGGQLFLSRSMLKSLPYTDRFGVIFAFSVFTHLSERSAVSCLETLRRHIRDDGLLFITLRPVEAWQNWRGKYQNLDIAEMMAKHRAGGYAYVPLNRLPREDEDGEVTFGEATMDMKYLQKIAKDWNLKSIDYSNCDQFQIYAALTPK
jgi:SAM-dependent methyltransferase